MKPITHKGRPVTSEEIQALADEAEAGIDIGQLKRRPGRPSLGSAAADVFPVRLDPELRAALEHAPKPNTSRPATSYAAHFATTFTWPEHPTRRWSASPPGRVSPIIGFVLTTPARGRRRTRRGDRLAANPSKQRATNSSSVTSAGAEAPKRKLTQHRFASSRVPSTVRRASALLLRAIEVSAIVVGPNRRPLCGARNLDRTLAGFWPNERRVPVHERDSPHRGRHHRSSSTRYEKRK